MMADIETVGSGDWEEKVEKAGGAVLVDFWAEWCQPCKMLTPIVEKMASENEGRLNVYKVDVGSDQELASGFGIMSIPVLVLFKDGAEAERMVGLRSEEEIRAMIDKHL
jgi:thioredoxin 1